MRIKWLGHSCFLITTEKDVKILTDPFDTQVGYPLPSEETDIVTTSHDHFDHGYVEAIKGSFIHISNPGSHVECGIHINGVSTFHDEVEGKKRGRNVIFVFEIDGLRLCHCGDLGHLPTEAQKNAIGNIDVMMLPVGGTFTVDAEEACKTVEILKPAVTIPMHYKTPAMNFPITGVDKFVEAVGLKNHPEVFANRQEVEITKSNLSTQPKVLVMDYI